MPLPLENLMTRHRGIGASEVALIMRGQTARLFYEKRPDLIGLSPADLVAARGETTAQSLGHLLEPLLVKQAMGELGVTGPRYRKDGVKCVAKTGRGAGVMFATLDWRSKDRRFAIDAKTGRHVGYGDDAGTDQVPEHVLLQMQAQCYCAGLERVFVPYLGGSYFGGLQWTLFRVERNQELIDLIVNRCMDWWERHVVAGVPPTDERLGAPAAPPLDLVQLMHRIPDAVLTEPSQPVLSSIAAWNTARQARLNYEKAEEAAEALLLQALGEHSGAILPDGRRLTVARTLRRAVSIAKLREMHPDIAEECTLESLTSPQVRLTKAPKESASTQRSLPSQQAESAT